MTQVFSPVVLQSVLARVGTALASLSQLIPSTTGRAIVTFGVAVAVTTVLSRTDRLHAIEPGRLPKTGWHLVVTLGTMVVAATGGLVIVAVWGLSDQLLGVFTANLGPEALVRFGISILFLIGAYTMTGLIRQLVEEIARARGSLGEHEREIAFRVGQVTLYVISVLLILTLWQVNIGGILVGAGFLGIVVGMAARQTLGALLAGFVLMFSRPFEIGDWVEVGDNEGIVTRITIVNTCLQTFDGEYVMIPNDEVSSQPILNRTRKGRLRIEVEVGVDYSVRPNRAAKIAVAAVDDLSAVSTAASPQAVIKGFGDSAVLLGVRAWVDDPSARKMWRARTAVVDAVHEAFDREGIEIPFPQRTVSRREGEVVAEAGDETVGGIPAADGSGGTETS